jgi:nicotinate phosphoribosyltransferase
MATAVANRPEGITSLLDTDLYKLTMQCCVLKFFPEVQVTYSFTNRTPEKKLNRRAFEWLQAQVDSRKTSSLPTRRL